MLNRGDKLAILDVGLQKGVRFSALAKKLLPRGQIRACHFASDCKRSCICAANPAMQSKTALRPSQLSQNRRPAHQGLQAIISK